MYTFKQALARSPGDPIGSELLSLALKEQTLSLFQATSRSEAVRFPFLCDQTAVRGDLLLLRFVLVRAWG